MGLVEIIQGIEHDVAFQPAAGFGALHLLLDGIDLVDAVHNGLDQGLRILLVLRLLEEFPGEGEGDGAGQPLLEFGGIQGGIAGACGEGGVRPFAHGGADKVHQEGPGILVGEDVMAEAVDGGPLLVHHVVVFQGAFPDAEMLLLHPFLGLFHGAAQPGMGEFLPFLHAHALHDAGDAVGAEEAHQVVFQGDIEDAGAGVSLAGAASPQLEIDAAGVMAFGADDVEAAQFPDAGSQLDVGASSGHVGGDGDGAPLARPGHNLRLALVLLGVQDVVDDALPGEQTGE